MHCRLDVLPGGAATKNTARAVLERRSATAGGGSAPQVLLLDSGVDGAARRRALRDAVGIAVWHDEFPSCGRSRLPSQL